MMTSILIGSRIEDLDDMQRGDVVAKAFCSRCEKAVGLSQTGADNFAKFPDSTVACRQCASEVAKSIKHRAVDCPLCNGSIAIEGIELAVKATLETMLRDIHSIVEMIRKNTDGEIPTRILVMLLAATIHTLIDVLLCSRIEKTAVLRLVEHKILKGD